MNFTGKTAVVTGGSRGIGRAICLELARGGANVMLCYAGNEEAALDTAAACEALGAKAAAMRCDVSKTDEVKALVDAALQQFGAVHILVNNAGITRDGLLMTMKEDAWDQVLDTNLKGAFLTMKAVARTMMKQRYGRIVNLSSVVTLCCPPFLPSVWARRRKWLRRSPSWPATRPPISPARSWRWTAACPCERGR